jgi:hypothetical protein
VSVRRLKPSQVESVRKPDARTSVADTQFWSIHLVEISCTAPTFLHLCGRGGINRTKFFRTVEGTEVFGPGNSRFWKFVGFRIIALYTPVKTSRHLLLF